MTSESKVEVAIRNEADIVAARAKGREVAISLGFSVSDIALIATAISELARNIINYASAGSVAVEVVTSDRGRGIRVVASDNGPGIVDVKKALDDGFSTGNGLGLGLPGTRRIMDDFEIVSVPERGTTVMAAKWLRGR